MTTTEPMKFECCNSHGSGIIKIGKFMGFVMEDYIHHYRHKEVKKK